MSAAVSVRGGHLARIVLLAFVCLVTIATGPASAEIRWYDNLKAASEAAQKADLPMFVDFWADWCEACKVMDADVYTDRRVIRAFEGKIIGVRLHYDLQADLARKYGVPALPYLLFTNSYGTPLMHHRGLLAAEDLAKVIDALPPLAEINRLDRALQQDKNDFPSLVAMGRALRDAGFYESSNTYLDRAAGHRLAKDDPATREALLYDMARNSLALQGEGTRAVDILEKLVKEFPRSPRRPEFLVALGRAYLLNEKSGKARETLTSVIRDYPRSAAAAEAKSLLGPP
jgi:thioredoxin-like negative regulator of GroEL